MYQDTLRLSALHGAVPHASLIADHVDTTDVLPSEWNYRLMMSVCSYTHLSPFTCGHSQQPSSHSLAHLLGTLCLHRTQTSQVQRLVACWSRYDNRG